MKSARGASAKPRSTFTWSRDELLRLLHAWRDVLLQQPLRSSPLPSPPSSSDSSRAPPSQEARELQDANKRMFERFVELSRGTAHAPERRETSLLRKRQALIRTYRHAVEYNEQQNAGKRKNKRTKSRRNHWFALTAEQQYESLMTQFTKDSARLIDKAMFTILAVIDKAEKRHRERVVAEVPSKSVPWTKGEAWVLINAWRRVIEMRPKVRDRSSNISAMVHEQFVALSQEGMPRRTRGSINSKLALLVRLYRLIAEFNKLDGSTSNGPHEVDTPDWFSSSFEVQTEYVASHCDRQYKFTELDKDMFNAMELVVKFEDSLQNGVSSVRVNRNASQSIIDISSDTESEDDEHDGSTDWEILPVASSETSDARSVHLEVADAHASNGWSTSQHTHEPEGGRVTARANQHRHPPQVAVAATHRLPAASSVRVAASSDSEDETSSRARKRAKADSKQHFASQTESFLELLAKLKKERKADKLKRRKERAERKELMELIAKDREERLRDREERQKERAEWELERDKLKFKLRKIRERYKKAAAKLKSKTFTT